MKRKDDMDRLGEEMAKAQRKALRDEFARAASDGDVLSVLRDWNVDNTSLNRAKARYAFAERMLKVREI